MFKSFYPVAGRVKTERASSALGSRKCSRVRRKIRLRGQGTSCWKFSFASALDAEQVQANRQRVGVDNPFLVAQEAISKQIIEALDLYRDMRNQMVEAFFMNFYGAKPLQAMVGLTSDMATARPRIGRDVAREAAKAKSVASLEAGIARGGLIEASVRALLYIALGHPHPGADERSFAVVRRIRADLAATRELSLAQFKEVVRQQCLLLRQDEEHAVAAIPRLLPAETEERAKILNIIRRIVGATFAGLTAIYVGFRLYQGAFGLSAGLDSSEPAFATHWMRLLYLELAVLVIVFPALWGYLWFTRDRNMDAMSTKEEITRYFTLTMWISIYTFAVHWAGSSGPMTPDNAIKGTPTTTATAPDVSERSPSGCPWKHRNGPASTRRAPSRSGETRRRWREHR